MRKVSCSVLQSQALAVSSYVSADGSSVEESAVDLDEVIGTTDFYAIRERPCRVRVSTWPEITYSFLHTLDIHRDKSTRYVSRLRSKPER